MTIKHYTTATEQSVSFNRTRVFPVKCDGGLKVVGKFLLLLFFIFFAFIACYNIFFNARSKSRHVFRGNRRVQLYQRIFLLRPIHTIIITPRTFFNSIWIKKKISIYFNTFVYGTWMYRKWLLRKIRKEIYKFLYWVCVFFLCTPLLHNIFYIFFLLFQYQFIILFRIFFFILYLFSIFFFANLLFI